MSCVVSFIRGKNPNFDIECNYSFTTYSLKQYTSLRVIIITALASCRSTCIWSITYASDRLSSFIKPTQDDIIKGAREGVTLLTGSCNKACGPCKYQTLHINISCIYWSILDSLLSW